MILKSLLKLIRTDELLNIYDVIHNQYLHRNITKEGCDNIYNSYKVVSIITNADDYGNPLIEIEVANKSDLFIG